MGICYVIIKLDFSHWCNPTKGGGREKTEEIERQRGIAEIDKLRNEKLERARKLEVQQAVKNAKQLEKLKAANETLVVNNTELLSKFTDDSDVEQHLSEVTKEKQRLEYQLQVLSQKVLNEATLKDNDKKVKYVTGLTFF